MMNCAPFRLPLFVLLISLIYTAAVHAEPITNDWAAAARQDMSFAIDAIRSRHAGFVSGKVDVIDSLESGARVGMAEADKVQTQQDYRRAMARFINGFGDPHTGINLHLKTNGWTGLVLDRIGGQYRVVWSEPKWMNPLPPTGAVAQSCDGVWIGTYLHSEVAPFINHSEEYPTSPSEFARQSMFDMGFGWTPKQCVFTLADGSRKAYDLPLHAVPGEVSEERIDELKNRFRAVAKPVGLYRVATDKHLAGMPNFNGRISGAAYEELYGQLTKLNKSGWVIFDLRGNGGGNSDLGNRALKVLFGDAYGEKLGDNAAYAKYVTANQATIDLYKKYANAPEFAASKDGLLLDLEKLEKARAVGDKLALLDGTTEAQALTLAAQIRKRPGGPRIAALIDRGCFSSCMNFLQQIESMSDTVVLGEPTLGYSPYGEINRFDLPSGNAWIQIPSAVYSTFQAPKEPFMPMIPFPGNMADDAALMKWVNATLTSLK
jgi:hypothetical protein